FEKPDAEARAALWRKVFPASCQLADDFDADVIGRSFEMSGGSIRNAAVRAAFFAAAGGKPVDQEACLRAAEREAREMGFLTHSMPRPAVAHAETGGAPPPKPVPSASPDDDTTPAPP